MLLVACGNEPEAVETETAVTVDYRKQGDSLTNIAQQTLLKNVSGAMKEGGPVHAIEYCNDNATDLLGSLSDMHSVTISRISSKNRNPNGAPTASEEKLLTALEHSNKMDTLIEGTSTYYKSIKVGMPTCLKCHGAEGTDIGEETLATLNNLYPEDKARGYQLGDFRGAWKIVFAK